MKNKLWCVWAAMLFPGVKGATFGTCSNLIFLHLQLHCIISIVFIWIFNWIINLLLDFCCQPDEGKSQSHTTTVNIVLQSCRICPHFWYCSKVILLVYRITHYTQSSCTYIALYPTNQIWKIAKRSYLRAFSKTVPRMWIELKWNQIIILFENLNIDDRKQMVLFLFILFFHKKNQNFDLWLKLTWF